MENGEWRMKGRNSECGTRGKLKMENGGQGVVRILV